MTLFIEYGINDLSKCTEYEINYTSCTCGGRGGLGGRETSHEVLFSLLSLLSLFSSSFLDSLSLGCVEEGGGVKPHTCIFQESLTLSSLPYLPSRSGDLSQCREGTSGGEGEGEGEGKDEREGRREGEG